MSKTVDERVVSMQFDNSKFEKNVGTTMNTLEKLKSSLNLTGSSKGLENINSAVKNFDISPMYNGIENVKNKFSALETIATGALLNIGNKISNLGINLVKSLSIDNISAGWSKFQQKATSMSTLISQGYDTATVEKQLEKLNWFSDETSYNFTDMINNISKFTATGQNLESSVTAMEGIALWAAKSGQNAQKASGAMYQLSQALGAGFMRKEDWKSIQSASMDTSEFRQQTLDAAVALGTLKKVGTDTYKSLTGNGEIFTKNQFAESLTEGKWFTSDVMMKAYQGYAKGAEQVKSVIDKMNENYSLEIGAGDILSGYSAYKNNTFDEYLKKNDISGDSAEALKKMISELDNFGISALKAGQEYRTLNDVIDATKDAVSTKWMNIFETIIGNVDQQKALWSEVGAKFYEWFAEPLNSLNSKLKEWATLGGRDSLFKGLGNIFETLENAIKSIKKAFSEIFPEITAKQLFNLTEKFKNFTEKIKLSDDQLEKIKITFKGLFSVFNVVLSIAKKVISVISKFLPYFSGLINLVLNVTSTIGNWIYNMSTATTTADIFGKAIDGITGFIEKFIDKLKEIKNFIKSKFESKGFEAFLNLLKSIWDFIKKIGSKIAEFSKQIIDSLSTLFQNGDLNKGMNLFNGGLLAGLLVLITKFVNKISDLDKIKKDVENIFSLDKIKNVLSEVGNSLKEWQNSLKVDSILKIASALAILSVSLLILSSIDQNKLTGALIAITALFAELAGSLAVFNEMKIDFGKIGKISSLMLSLSASVLILSLAIKAIGDLTPEQLVASVSAILSLFAMLITSIKMMETSVNKKSKKVITDFAGQMLVMSFAIGLLALVMKLLGSMTVKQIVKAGIAVAGITGVFMIVSKMMEYTETKTGTKKIVKFAGQMVTMSFAIGMVALVMKLLGSMTVKQLAKAGIAVAGITGVLATVMYMMSNTEETGTKTMTKFAGQMLVMSFAIGILSLALIQIAKLSLDQLKTGLIGLAGSMIILAYGLSSMSGKDILKGSAALLIASAALMALVPVLFILGKMPIEVIATALLAIAGIFYIFYAASLALKDTSAVILKVSASIIVFGIACAVVGAGLLLIGMGITSLAVALTSGVSSIMASIIEFLSGLGKILTTIFDAITESASSLGKAVKTVIFVLLDVLEECIPKIVTGILKTIIETLNGLISYADILVDKIVDVLIIIINKLTTRIPDLISCVTLFLVELINSISSNISLLLDPLFNLITIIFTGLANALGPLINNVIAPILNILKDLIIGIVTAIAPHIPEITIAIQAICSAFTVLITNIEPIINSISNLIESLGKTISDVFNSISNIISSCGETITDVLNGLSGTFDSVFNGISGIISSVGDSIKNVLDGISGIISSIGDAALDAGTGFENLANGVKIITDTNLGDMVGSLAAVATGLGAIASHSEDLSKAGIGMQQIANGTTMSANAFYSISYGINLIIPMLYSLETSVNYSMNSMSNSIYSLSNLISTNLIISFSNAISIINEKLYLFMNLGMSIIKYIMNGINNNSLLIINSFINIISSSLLSLNSYYNSFYSSGSYLVDGFASGIKNNSFKAKSAAYLMAKEALNAARKELDINSPSKEFEKIGDFVPEGFANGINKNISVASNASKTMASMVIDNAKNAISKLASITSDGMNLKPSIIPVIDMSNLDNKSAKLNTDIDASVSGPVDSLSQIVSNAQADINSSNQEVISAINSLRQDISDLYNSDDKEISLYVDSKKLASSIAKPMDRQLSILSKKGAY